MSYKQHNNETVEVFAICYNEEYLLPHFIRHYKEQFGATITIYDNFSTDRSREIIESMGCKYLTYDSGNQIRDDMYVNIKNNCWKTSKADWVIVCDIDEFLEVDFNVKEATIVNSKGFDMLGEPDSRMGVANALMSKHIMFRPKHFKEIAYSFGCHRCSPILNVGGRLVGTKSFAKLLHRKFTSEDRVYKKHLEYESRLSDLNKKYGWGIHYLGTTKESITKQFDDLRKSAALVLRVIN